jgi:hypothetical protein
VPVEDKLFATLDTTVRILQPETRPRPVVFRSNHASNCLPLAGTLPQERDDLVAIVATARAGAPVLRPEFERGLRRHAASPSRPRGDRGDRGGRPCVGRIRHFHFAAGFGVSDVDADDGQRSLGGNPCRQAATLTSHTGFVPSLTSMT